MFAPTLYALMDACVRSQPSAAQLVAIGMCRRTVHNGDHDPRQHQCALRDVVGLAQLLGRTTTTRIATATRVSASGIAAA